MTPTVSPDERTRGQAMAEKLPMRSLTRMWQMLLKALEEVAIAPSARMAADMAVIRLTHVADLPSPEDLVRKLQNTPAPPPTPPVGGGATARRNSHSAAPPPPRGPTGGGAPALAVDTDTSLARYMSFDSVVALIRHNRDVKLLIEVETCLRLVSYTPGRIEFSPTPNAPPRPGQPPCRAIAGLDRGALGRHRGRRRGADHRRAPRCGAIGSTSPGT